MTDIRTIWDAAGMRGVWDSDTLRVDSLVDENGNSLIDESGAPLYSVIAPGTGLAVGDDLASAVLISLFTDATADVDDVLPDKSGDRRGWWAGPIGSKLWLRFRARADETTRALVEDDVRTALQWLVEDGVAVAVEVTARWERPGFLSVSVIIRRGNGTTRALSFSRIWEQI